MNTLGSWIDPQLMAGAAQDLAVRASLAEEFAMLLAGPATSQPQALRLDDFKKEVAAPELPPEEKNKVRNMLEEVKRRASMSGLLKNGSGGAAPALFKNSATESAATGDQESILSRRGLPFFVPPFGPLATRIRAFIDWLKRQVQAESLFIVDAQGCPVSDAEPEADILASALLLSDAARRAARHVPSTGEGALHVDLPEGKKLCVIHTETTYGHFCLGLVSLDSMSPSTADRLRRALQRTVESDTDTGPVRIDRP